MSINLISKLYFHQVEEENETESKENEAE